MPIVRVDSFAVSLDGFAAGPDQSLENPLGVGGPALHDWFYPTRTFRKNVGDATGGETSVDDQMAAPGMQNVGCWILGRNMFTPSRGDWPDDGWTGWWGEEPPYHCPTIVLTTHPRAPLEMKGGTVFHFETGGIGAALDKARAFAGDRDVRIGGGASTVRQYLQARLIDRLHVVVSPVLLGHGEPLWSGLDLTALGYGVTSRTQGERATHVIIERA